MLIGVVDAVIGFIGNGDNGTRRFGNRQNGGAASLASDVGKYEVLAFYRLGVANAASRRREGKKMESMESARDGR